MLLFMQNSLFSVYQSDLYYSPILSIHTTARCNSDIFMYEIYYASGRERGTLEDALRFARRKISGTRRGESLVETKYS